METAFEIGHFRTLQTSTTMTVDRVIRHTIMYHSLTFTYMRNFVQIGKTFLWMDGQTHEQMYGQTMRPALLGRLGGVT